MPLATASYYFDSIGELVAEALRRFVQARPAKEALTTYRQSAQAGLRAIGAQADDRQSRAYVALALGMGLMHLVDPEDDDPEQLFEAIRDLFLGPEQVATDPTGVAVGLATPAAPATAP